jgi:hypothetical protein
MRPDIPLNTVLSNELKLDQLSNYQMSLVVESLCSASFGRDGIGRRPYR